MVGVQRPFLDFWRDLTDSENSPSFTRVLPFSPKVIFDPKNASKIFDQNFHSCPQKLWHSQVLWVEVGSGGFFAGRGGFSGFGHLGFFGPFDGFDGFRASTW